MPEPGAPALIAAYAERGWRLATAESCTGGLIAGALTEVPGSSAVVECGFVTYSNEAKAAMLGVDPMLIEQHGAVSEAVARAMAQGALARSGVDVAVSVTGVAGPGGGTDLKPIGLVHFGLAARNLPTRHRMNRFGALERAAIRALSVAEALALLDLALRD